MSVVKTQPKSKTLEQVRDIMYSRLLTKQEAILRPIEAQGFTEICKTEGEKRAFKCEVDFIRTILDLIDRT